MSIKINITSIKSAVFEGCGIVLNHFFCLAMKLRIT